MNELILQQPGRFVIRDGPEPRAGAGDALVRVHRVGICGSDVHAFRGTMPFVQCPRILGHELGVEVQTAPPNERGIRAGDRCAVEPYLACGTCHACGLDRPNCCESLRVLGIHMDGGMRPLFSVPVSCLHASRKLSVDQLALIETLGIGAHAVARSGLAEGERALVVGVGAIGLTTLQFAMAQGAAVTALEINDRRRAFVASRFGVEALAEPDGRDYDVVFDATGNVQAMEASFEHVAAGGRLVFVGLINDRLQLGLYWKFPQQEIPIVTQWQHFHRGTYVTGVEPGNASMLGRAWNRKHGYLQYIQPGQVRDFHLEIGVLDGEKEIRAFERQAGKAGKKATKKN